MKNKKIILILSIVFYLIVISLSSIYLVIPGIKKINEANNIKELSFDEKTKLIDDINQKYIDLEKKVNDKYSPNITSINEKYDNLKVSIEEKYDKLEIEIEDKYKNEEKELNNKINDNKVLQNKEFFANGLSKKYYELSDKGTELFKEKSSLESKKREEIRKNETNERKELNDNEDNKDNELNTIEKNKKDELIRLSQKKESEILSINNRKSNKKEIRSNGLKKISLAIIIVSIPLIYVVMVFNKLTKLLNVVKEKWSQVDVLLKQRADLIPNIVETVKGYSTHEKSTLTKITKARNQFVNASSKEDEINANNDLDTAVSRLLVLQEDYPELKADTNFMSLQNSLSEIEENISYKREEYNKSVLKYKNKLEMFPSNIVAGLFKFKPELFFKIDDTEKDNVNINFN